MSEYCLSKKRPYAETDLTPPKMPSYKAGKLLEDNECEDAISKMDSTFFPIMAPSFQNSSKKVDSNPPRSNPPCC